MVLCSDFAAEETAKPSIVQSWKPLWRLLPRFVLSAIVGGLCKRQEPCKLAPSQRALPGPRTQTQDRLHANAQTRLDQSAPNSGGRGAEASF
eukprot:294496-Amphidinium_carterae.1